MKKTMFSLFLLSASITTSLTFAATVATVNGVDIDDGIIKQNLSQIPAAILKGREADLTKQLLGKLVEQEIIKQEAVRLKVEEMDEYKKQLETIKMTLSSNILLKKVVNDLVTEEAIKKAFDENLDRFTTPGVKARHILVETKEYAEKLVKSLDKGASFEVLAKTDSKGPSAKNGGDLGWFGPTDMVKEFSDVAFMLAKGSYNKVPVKTKFGWHIILVEDKKEKMAPEFAAVKGKIQKQMQDKTVADYLAQLKSNAKVTYK
jgi:peptidyl-prolyl cis-trans isomerase C